MIRDYSDLQPYIHLYAGESAHIMSPHYDDMLDDYAFGRYSIYTMDTLTE